MEVTGTTGAGVLTLLKKRPSLLKTKFGDFSALKKKPNSLCLLNLVLSTKTMDGSDLTLKLKIKSVKTDYLQESVIHLT
ncbi:hypothetical protein [Butyrivibrio sp. TB]|uniref:hypothetical protein n=1 Tax=Butyrivibrio sp. TB TaxID=1520809 RepID=UPI000B8A3F3C|nr:hypothetical protein [Butyrivibrio sp. TB]